MSYRVLITGASGFIGSHFLDYFTRFGGFEYETSGLDSFWHKGQYTRLDDLVAEKGEFPFHVYRHDLSVPIDDTLIKKMHADTHPFDYIINLASNSAVERSVHNPVECWRNNCDLILNMLEFARKYPPRMFVQVSTDEVYGDYVSSGNRNSDNNLGHHEWDTILPSNPYAASKAAQEALCIAYWRSYKLPIVICNTMNNIGERQDQEKFLPRIIGLIAQDKEVIIYADNDGSIGSRVYLDAQDHAAAIKWIMKHGAINYDGIERMPLRYNVCGNTELDNLQVAEHVANKLNKKLKYRIAKADSVRPGYDKRYLLDGTKLHMAGWSHTWAFEQTVDRIIKHVMEKPWWL